MTTLSSGQKLVPGQSLQSNNKLHTFIMQPDGNVVLYDRNSKPLWSTNTGGLTSPRPPADSELSMNLLARRESKDR